jgi:Tfp pilus assembly protein PilX
MKGAGRQQKSQTLIVVLVLLFLGTIIGTGLMRMWETEVRTNSVSDDGRLALYLAQAAVERGKYELRQNWNYAGEATPVTMGTGRYTIGIDFVSAGPPERKRVTGTGWVREAMRRLQVLVESTSTPGPCTTEVNCTNVSVTGANCTRCGGHVTITGWSFGSTCPGTISVPCWWEFDFNFFFFRIRAHNCLLTITILGICFTTNTVCYTCTWSVPACANVTTCPPISVVNVTSGTWGAQ